MSLLGTVFNCLISWLAEQKRESEKRKTTSTANAVTVKRQSFIFGIGFS